MFANPSTIRLAIYGSEIDTQARGVGLWSAGYKGAVTAAGATPVFLEPSTGKETWNELLITYGFENNWKC